MSFQSFCDDAYRVDEQKVAIADSLVIKMFKADGSGHCTDLADALEFLEFLRDNHADCVSAIEGDPDFPVGGSFSSYREKPYRALYAHAAQSGLRIIGTLGLSQTKALTQVISKLIAYLSDKSYDDVKKHTLFDKTTVELALERKPTDLRTFIDRTSSAATSNLVAARQELFEAYLQRKKLAPKTVRKYSEQAINKADQLFAQATGQTIALYEADLAEVERAQRVLDGSGDWREANNTGNNMYKVGLKHYLDFMSERSLLPTNEVACPKPFILLAGISGTGKTRFVRRQALATARNKQSPENFCLVPVRPDWHEPSDLLGYVSRIGDSPRFISTKTLDFMIKAWREVAPDADAKGPGELLADSPPYWLCLDEMNLAPVEQYFADYLSVLETREVKESVYRSDPLLQGTELQKHKEGSGDLDYRRDLGLQGAHNEGLWQFFCAHGIQLPPNLIVAGTVNMDETTHGFSRKVIDRALTLDFGEFFPNDFDLVFGGQFEPVTLTYSKEARARPEALIDTIDSDGKKTIEFLKQVNRLLQGSPFELAYRALNEVLLMVACFKPQDEASLQAVWDDFLMTKVLPRIEGDADKLMSTQSDSGLNLLDDLQDLLGNQLAQIWDDSEGGTRPDYLRKAADGDRGLVIDCRSRKKLQWMQRKLETNTFTSFWP